MHPTIFLPKMEPAFLGEMPFWRERFSRCEQVLTSFTWFLQLILMDCDYDTDVLIDVAGHFEIETRALTGLPGKTSDQFSWVA